MIHSRMISSADVAVSCSQELNTIKYTREENGEEEEIEVIASVSEVWTCTSVILYPQSPLSSIARDLSPIEKNDQMALNSFILGCKGVVLFLLISLSITASIVSTPLFHISLLLLLIEVIVAIVVIAHTLNGHLALLVSLIGLEACIGLGGMGVAMTVMIMDHAQDCSISHCHTLNLSATERFYIFWILMAKGMIELFLCLMVVAISPLIKEHNADHDDALIFSPSPLKQNSIFEEDDDSTEWKTLHKS